MTFALAFFPMLAPPLTALFGVWGSVAGALAALALLLILFRIAPPQPGGSKASMKDDRGGVCVWVGMIGVALVIVPALLLWPLPERLGAWGAGAFFAAGALVLIGYRYAPGGPVARSIVCGAGSGLVFLAFLWAAGAFLETFLAAAEYAWASRMADCVMWGLPVAVAPKGGNVWTL
jgi:hypothetical protein